MAKRKRFDIEKEKKKLDKLHQRAMVNIDKVNSIHQNMKENLKRMREHLEHTKNLLNNFPF